MLIIDDYSRYTWVYMIKRKDEALKTFKGFKAQVESEGHLKLKGLRTDRGGSSPPNNLLIFVNRKESNGN